MNLPHQAIEESELAKLETQPPKADEEQSRRVRRHETGTPHTHDTNDEAIESNSQERDANVPNAETERRRRVRRYDEEVSVTDQPVKHEDFFPHHIINTG
jgi:hypothetical protein